MIINIHAGHNPDNKIACGAIGLIKESTENRKVKNKVISYLRKQGHTVYDCTCDNGSSSNDVLVKIVKKCNAHKVNLDVSINFNSGAKDKKGNGKSTGTEVLIYSNSSKAKKKAKSIVNEISKLGFKNRGVKVRSDLYVLRKTNAPALLIECCFVDDKDDVKIYDCDEMARAIVKGITGKSVTSNSEKKKESHTEKKKESDFKIPSLKGYKGNSIVDGLNSFGYNSSFSYRKKVWKALGKTTTYKGTSTQNTQMLTLLKRR